VILILDNYDSFTYNLVDLVQQFGVEIFVVRNDELSLSEIIKINPTAILISPGPGRPENAGILMELINFYVGKIPLLGICLGHQAIALHYGSSLINAEHCMHGKVSSIVYADEIMFDGVMQGAEMMRYHSLIISDLASELQATAHAENGELMAFKHKSLDIWALQFHPESILSSEGPKIIKNWLTHFQLIK
jgi:anthranilate synthase component II